MRLLCRLIRLGLYIDASDLLTAQNIFAPEQQMQKNDVLVVITGATIKREWQTPLKQ